MSNCNCPSCRARHSPFGVDAPTEPPDTATLSRIGGVWQLRATRSGGSARLSVDTDLDDAFDKLRAFLGGT